MSRTPEEREAARLERERRRAARAGRTLPPEPELPPAYDPPSPGPAEPHVPAEPLHDPHATQMFDVTTTWTDEHRTVAAPVAEAERPEPPAPAPEPPAAEREPLAPAPEPPAPEPAPVDPPTSDHEVPLGTRRVGRHERLARVPHPHLHRRHPRSPAPPRAAGTTATHPRWGRRIAALLVIAIVSVAGWLLWSIYQPATGDGSGRVVVTIPRGAGVSEIGDLLASRGVIDSAFFFGLRAKLSGSGGDLKSGTFTLRAGMSYGSALDALSHEPPPPPVVKVTIPEGHDRRGVAEIARSDGLTGDYMAASRSSVHGFDLRRYGAPRGATLEGFLFPATYELKPGTSVRKLVDEQLAAFRQNIRTVDLRYARSKNLTVYDVVTIASMVEREVAVARERPLVAAVIYNRLKQGMPLGIDATLRFALNDWTSPLTVSQLASRNPYNTRNHQGLPPGPIGNPGLASLQAAAHPAHVPYLFYVVKPGTCGQHAFSSTDAQFQQDVQRYDRARAAAGGRSPEKC